MYKLSADSVIFKRDVASHSDDIFGKVRGHANKLFGVIAILMHTSSLSCCHGINLEDSRDYLPTGTELISVVQE